MNGSRVPVRSIATGALAIAVIALALVVVGGGGSYSIQARFANASELVTGGQVDVAGRPVGSITGISLAPDGEANVTMAINDSGLVPLHAGTRAAIAAVGLAGVDNRFVTVLPGPAGARPLASGAVLPSVQTASIVNFDAVLDALDRSTRSSLQQLITHSADVYAGSGSRYFNELLARLDPAMSQLSLTTGELANDGASLEQLVSTAARAATAAGSSSDALRGAVLNTAQTLSAIAAQRGALAGILTRAPAVLQEGQTTLTRLGQAARALAPTLREVRPLSRPLGVFLRQATSTLRTATPAVDQLVGELPGLGRSLAGLRPLAPTALRALAATTPALTRAMPILAGFREYGPDFILGIINGLAGISSGNYDQVGHYVRVEFVQSFQTLVGGLAGTALDGTLGKLANGIFKLRTHLYAICPGGNAPPATDHSSPWIPNTSICDPADDVPASVNTP